MLKGSELHSSLTQCLKELRLPTMRACYEEEAESARQESLTYERYLLEVSRREREQKWTPKTGQVVKVKSSA